MSTNGTSQIVFIDSRVPDLQGLLAGLLAGEQAFVLDPSSDGLQQIADILAANNLTDVSSISIVSHGETGELQLGSSLVTDASLASHAAALAHIGSALAPGGSIQLFGCDVAQGATGQQFIDDFSALAGGAPVEASTELVGAADVGGSWTLNASSDSESAPAVSRAPFTLQALANFQGTLAVTHPDGELFYVINAADNELGDISSTGTTGTEVFGDGTNNYATIAVDPAAGLVFTNGQGVANSGAYNAVVVHSATTGAVLTTVPFGPNDGNINNDDVVNAVAINPFTNTLLVGDWGTDNAHTGVREFTYTASGALTPVATNGGFLFTAAQTETTSGNDATSRFTDALAMYLDTKNNLLYYVDDDGGYNFSPYHATNGIYVVGTTGPTFSPTELTSNGSGTGQFPTADQSGAGTNIGANGNIVALAVNVAQGIVYFETTFTDSESSPHNALWWVSTTGANQTATQITLPSGDGLFPGQSSEGGDAAGLTFDPQTRQLYVTNAFETATSPDNSDIYVFQLDSTGHTISSTAETLGSQALLNQSPSSVNPDEVPGATTFDVAPVLTVTGTGSSPIERGAAVTLAASLSATDTDGNHFASATVSITGGTFAPGDTSAADDHLSVNGATSGVLGGTNITVSYNSSTETLTLTGYDTITNYQTALDEVEFQATGHNPTNFGSNTTRTVTWTVSDGATNITAGSQNSTTSTVTVVGVNDPPTLSNVATTAAYTEAGTAPTLSSAVTVTDVDDLDLASATVSITGAHISNGTFSPFGQATGDLLSASTAGTSISASYNSTTETLTLTGADTLAHYQQVLDTVAFSDPGNLNPTNYGSDPTRLVTWVLKDPSGTANGGSDTSTAATTTVSITAVDNPPTLSGVATSVSAGLSTLVTLSPSVTVTDPDNLTLASATVAVTGGTFNGDGDVLAANTSGTSISASYNASNETLVLTNVDTIADYEQVLDSVTFIAGGADPTSGGTVAARTVSWTVNDGGLSSTAKLTTVSILDVLSSGQTIFVSAGQTSTGIVVTSGSEVVVLSGGTADTIFVRSSGVEVVDVGGTASGTIVSSGGIQYDAGTASNTVLSGGNQQVFGSAAGTTIDNGGTQDVISGGTASGTTVSSGGIQYDAGTASNTTLSGGGSQIVFGSAASTTIDSGGTQTVVSGGIASGTTVSSGGIQYDNGTASGTTVSNSGTEVVFGSDAGTTIVSGGTQNVISGGTASGTTVSSGGIQNDNGTASGTTLDGGTENVFGSDVSAIVSNGGIQNVVSGGIASGTIVSSGGVQNDAGTASNTTVSSGGSQTVFGSADGTTVDSGGMQAVASGGTASGTTVSIAGFLNDARTAIDTTLSGGGMEVFSGGIVSGATISGGELELQSGATAGSSTITFSGGGTLRLDATGAYSFLVAGFAVPDAFDLSLINFASATSGYSGNTSSGTLTVSDGTHSASILLLGNYTAGSFQLNPETGGGTGTVVTDPPTGLSTSASTLAGNAN